MTRTAPFAGSRRPTSARRFRRVGLSGIDGEDVAEVGEAMEGVSRSS